MKIPAKRSELSDDFLNKINRGVGKGVIVDLKKTDDLIYILVTANGRDVGEFNFRPGKDENYYLTYKMIIEREFYPLEAAIYRLMNYLHNKKGAKVKYIIWE